MIEKDLGGRPFGSFKISVEQIKETWNKYITYCARFTVEHATGSGKVVEVLRPRVPSIGEFLERLDISYQLWENYTKLESHKEFSETVGRINEIIQSRKVAALLNGEGNSTGLIFDLKANYGWKDKQTVEHTGDLDNQLIVRVIDGNQNK
jgi:hypothetical protein